MIRAALLGALVLSGLSFADDVVVVNVDNDRPIGTHLLVINPGDLFNGIATVEYEQALGPNFGVTLGVEVFTFRGVFAPSTQQSYVAIVPELGARIHFLREAPGGLWFGPYIGAGYIASRSTGNVTRAFGWGLGAALGYNFILGDRFVFQLGVGSGINDFGDGVFYAPRIRLGVGAVF